MLQEFRFNYAGQEHTLLYEPSRPTNSALHEVFQAQVYPYLPFLAPAQVIVDIGANVGFATVLFAALYPTARIYSFEPGHDAFQLLLRNTAGLPQIRVFPFGLLDVDDTCQLFHGQESSVTSSLATSGHNGTTSETGKVRRAAEVLDELGLSEITLLKIDTEGAEVPILRNLSSQLSNIAAIMLEYHADDDRRQIDHLLASTHLLFACRSKQPHRGTLVYVRRKIISERTAFDRLRISMSATA